MTTRVAGAERAMPSQLTRLVAAVHDAQRQFQFARIGGPVVEATASHYRIAGIAPFVLLGECVEFNVQGRSVIGQVVRLDEDAATMKAFEDGTSLGLGHPVWAKGLMKFAPDLTWKGRVLNALAQPIDGRGGVLTGPRELSPYAQPPMSMQRQRITRALTTGVKVIDLFTPLSAGQRIGVFAGSGVGKSTLLGMLAQSRGFDSSVIALVGERGREVKEFIDDTLGTALGRATVVVSTGDESPMMRRQAPLTAMLIAEHYRDCGDNVLLIIDSVTRYAHELREIALASGEPPVARGYTPSVFTELPKLLERAGPSHTGHGAITGVFSVLVDGDDHNEPIADTIRGILDGHVVLDRAIALRGRYPSVDVLRSVSRIVDRSRTVEQAQLIRRLRALVSEFEESRELRVMGAYKPGASPEIDRAVKIVPRLYEFLSQEPGAFSAQDPFQELAAHVATWG